MSTYILQVDQVCGNKAGDEFEIDKTLQGGYYHNITRKINCYYRVREVENNPKFFKLKEEEKLIEKVENYLKRYTKMLFGENQFSFNHGAKGLIDLIQKNPEKKWTDQDMINCFDFAVREGKMRATNNFYKGHEVEPQDYLNTLK